MFSGLQRRSPGFTSAMLSPVTRKHKEKETLISVLMFASGPFHGKISTLALALNIEAPKTFFRAYCDGHIFISVLCYVALTVRFHLS